MKTLLNQTVRMGLFWLTKIYQALTPSLVQAIFYEYLSPVTNIALDNGDTLTFFSPNYLCQWRARTLLTKEPGTTEWLNSMGPDDILFDVGANVGLYSLYPAKRNGTKVYSFEPTFNNYQLLNSNIYLNRLDQKVRAFCFGLSDDQGIDKLNISDVLPGSAIVNLGEAKDHEHRPMKPMFIQGTFYTSLDKLIRDFNLPTPTHLKIDVDGLEAKIIEGASQLLKDPQLKSVLIELNENLEDDQKTEEKILANGFQVSRKDRISNDPKSEFHGFINIIFTRSTTA